MVNKGGVNDMVKDELSLSHSVKSEPFSNARG